MESSVPCPSRAASAELRPGQVVLVDVDQHLELEASALYRQVFVLVPRVLLGSIPRSAHGKPTEPESPTDRFVVDHIRHLASTPSPSDARPARLMTQALLAHLRLLTPVHDALRSGGASRIERALDFIELHLGDPSLSAEAVAAAQGVGRRHLDALFRRRGLTVRQAIWRCRLDRAALRLRSAAWKDETVLAIGLESGFSSASHFARIFREAFGQTPSASRASKSPFG